VKEEEERRVEADEAEVAGTSVKDNTRIWEECVATIGLRL